MDSRYATSPSMRLGAAVLAASALAKLKSRLELSKAKHRSLTGHARMSRRIAALVPFYEFDERTLLPRRRCARRDRRALAAPASRGWRELYRAALRRDRAADRRDHATASPTCSSPAPTGCRSSSAASCASTCAAGSFLQSSSGVTRHRSRRQPLLRPDRLLRRQRVRLRLLQGLHGSRAPSACATLGPVLGAYHPVVAYNVARLRADLRPRRGVVPHVRHRGGDAGGAACALSHAAHAPGALLRRLSRLVGRRAAGRRQSRCRRTRPTRWRTCRRTRCACCARAATSPACWSIRCRRCIPTPNAPADSALVDSARSARFDRAAYTAWLQQLRAVCSERGIVLIFDEVFVGFRLAPGGAQEYFGVRADMVTYGKTLGGGLPVGVVCGRRHLMKRYRDDRPVDVCFARGTFNSHPYVMGAMHEFLRRLETPESRARSTTISTRSGTSAPSGSTTVCATTGLPVAGRQPVVDLDRQLHAAVALQLDAAVLPARRRPGARAGSAPAV